MELTKICLNCRVQKCMQLLRVIAVLVNAIPRMEQETDYTTAAQN